MKSTTYTCNLCGGPIIDDPREQYYFMEQIINPKYTQAIRRETNDKDRALIHLCGNCTDTIINGERLGNEQRSKV